MCTVLCTLTKLTPTIYTGAIIFIVVGTVGSMGFVNVKQAMAAGLTGVRILPTNNVVTIKASYEVLFTTAVTGTIKTITVAFPATYSVLSAVLIERSGIGVGSLSASGTVLTYSAASPVSVLAGTVIRLEFANIIQPSTVGAQSIIITTKDAGGNIIDGPTTGSTILTQIGSSALANGAVTASKLASNSVTTNDLVNGAVTTPKIATGAVTATKIAGLSKIIFSNFCTITWQPSADSELQANCSVPGIAPGDSVLVTQVSPTSTPPLCDGFSTNEAPLFHFAFVTQNIVTIHVINECRTANTSPVSMTYSILAFHP
jgi:hypothetical protein